MVLLAGGVLVVGLLLAVGNAMRPGPDNEVDLTSPSARSSARATPSGSAAPVRSSLGLMVVSPGEPPLVGDVPAPYWAGWIRAREELVVRTDPSDAATSLRMIAAGETAFAATMGRGGERADSDWLFVLDPDPLGWVRVTRGGVALADGYSADSPSSLAENWSLIGGSQAFVAAGNAWGPGETGGAWLVASGDAAHWSAPGGALPANYGGWLIADGPAGWLALSNPFPPEGRNLVWLSSSADGVEWTSVGALGLGLHNLVPDALYGSEAGYLLASWQGAWRQHWFSSDGRTWLEMPRPDFLDFTDTEIREAAAPVGFYVWDADGRHGGTGAYTGDGAEWLSTEVGPTGSSSEVVGLGDALLGLDNDPDGSGIRVWLGRPQPDAFGWTRDAGGEASLAGTALALLVADGQRAVAVTVDLDTEAVRAWTTPDGHDWTPLALPDGEFGVIPHAAASSRSEILVVGREDRDGIQLPVIWRLVGDTWDALPFADAVPFDIPSPACPEVPTETLDFLGLNPELAASCWGDRQASFPAYAHVRTSYFGDATGLTPTWLALDAGQWISLSPYATDWESGAWVVLAPTATGSLDAGPGWFQITGHFNDPAADSCRRAWSLDTLAGYPGREDVVRRCREVFVVTEVAPLPDR